MPKAKLVTRSASTSSVTADSIPKNSGLTNEELDSNFINLRDQGWRLRADDSTQHTITADTQINFSGGTITTDANGDITVSNLGGGGGGAETITALTSASTIAVNVALGSVFTVTLAHDATFNFSNFSTGKTCNIKIKQDSTGSRTAAFTGVKFAHGQQNISGTANAISFVTIFNDGTDILGAINRNYA